MEYVVLVLSICVIFMLKWMLTREETIRSPFAYYIFGAFISYIWSLCMDGDHLIRPDEDFFGIFSSFPYRSLIYRLPVAIGAIASVVALARQEVTNGRTIPRWLHFIDSLATRCRNRWPYYNVGPGTFDIRKDQQSHTSLRR